jgi:catalase
MQEVGVLELNRNPEDYHRDVEQAAFSPGSLVPGIELSPDTLLQWRAFLYVTITLFLLRFGTDMQLPRCSVPPTWICQYSSDSRQLSLYVALRLVKVVLNGSHVQVPLTRQLLG